MNLPPPGGPRSGGGFFLRLALPARAGGGPMSGDWDRLKEWLQRLMRQRMFLLMIGGALGTHARYSVGPGFNLHPRAQNFPYSTLVINVSGSFILGIAAVIITERLPPEYGYWYLLVGTGFCGGYTTFSTFEWETFQLVRNGSWPLALANVVVSVLAGFLG